MSNSFCPSYGISSRMFLGRNGIIRDFVFGLARSETPAHIGDLMEQTGFDRNKLNQYRRRLEKEGVVLSPQRGYIDFVIPFMKDYLIRRDEDQ